VRAGLVELEWQARRMQGWQNMVSNSIEGAAAVKHIWLAITCVVCCGYLSVYIAHVHVKQ
jgi:hypothetical protein